MKKTNGFVLVLGTLMMAAGLLLTTLARSVAMLVTTVGLLFFTGTGAVCFGIIMGAISPVLGEHRASAASGILNASSGIGGSLLSPLMQALQASLGVGKLLVILSAPVLVLLPICLWVARVSSSPVEETRTEIDVLGRLKLALSDPDYRRLMIGFGTCGFHMCIIQTHIFSQIVSYGIAEHTASLAYTMFGLTTMAGSVLCGFLCQRLALKNVLGVALRHSRGDRCGVHALAAQDGVYGVPVHHHIGHGRRRHRDAHLGDRVPAVRAGELGLFVRHYLRGPSDRRVYQLMAGRSIHRAERKLSGNLDVRNRAVRPRLGGELWHPQGGYKAELRTLQRGGRRRAMNYSIRSIVVFLAKLRNESSQSARRAGGVLFNWR